jgi:hypothetical protein
MSKFSIDTGVAGKAFQCKSVHVGTPDGILAWPFENQTGKYGRYLNSSVLYCGVSGGIKVIPAGTSKASLKVGIKGEGVVFKQLTAGTNYTAGTTFPTTDSNPNNASGITVQVFVDAGGAVQSMEIINGGSGYNVGDIITVVETGRPAGSTDCTFQILKLERGIPTSDEEVSCQVVAGQFLPLAVDYITNTDTNATRDGIIVCK